VAKVPIEKVFGESVRSRRIMLNLSQEALADACSLHRTYISSVERGERNVSLINIVAIAKALGVAAADLLKDARL
jgi:transcriptional regulator with XRE-family HTH domain